MTIFNHNDNLAAQLDSSSVSLLEARFPASSLADSRFLESKWQRGPLFATINDLQARSKIWQRVCSLTCRIPSIHTFI